jgi:DNA-binding LacI/PurR family transcriptional regulator
LVTTSVRDRHAGYRKALEEYGLPYDESLVCQLNFDQKRNPFLDYLAQPNRPNAIFASNDHLAAKAVQAAQMLGLSVPDDLAVIGFDNVEFAAYMNPALTTIAQPSRDIGLHAANLLIGRIEGQRGTPRHVELQTHLIVRDSCGAKLKVKMEANK